MKSLWLVSCPGLSGCLFSCSNSPKPQEVSLVCHGEPALSVHHALFWSVLYSLGFYQMHGCSDSLPQKGINIFLYLDNWLVRGKSWEQVLSRSSLHCLFDCLDFILNKGKVTLISTQKIEFIGALLDSISLRAFLLNEQFLAIYQLQCQPSTTVCVCLSVLGHLTSCTCTVQNTRLFPYPLQVWLRSVYHLSSQSLDKYKRVSQSMLHSLQLCTALAIVCQGVPFTCLPPTMTVVINASLKDWGVHLGILKIQGLWLKLESSLHINMECLPTSCVRRQWNSGSFESRRA